MLSTLKYAGAANARHVGTLAAVCGEAMRTFASVNGFNPDNRKKGPVAPPRKSPPAQSSPQAKAPEKKPSAAAAAAPKHEYPDLGQGKKSESGSASASGKSKKVPITVFPMVALALVGLGVAGYQTYQMMQKQKHRAAAQRAEKASDWAAAEKIRREMNKELDVKSWEAPQAEKPAAKPLSVPIPEVKLMTRVEEKKAPTTPAVVKPTPAMEATKPVAIAAAVKLTEEKPKAKTPGKPEEPKKLPDIKTEGKVISPAPIVPSTEKKPAAAPKETKKPAENAVEKKPAEVKPKAAAQVLTDQEKKQLKETLEKNLNDIAHGLSAYINKADLPTWKIEVADIFSERAFRQMEGFSITAATTNAKEKIKRRLRLDDKTFYQKMDELVPLFTSHTG